VLIEPTTNLDAINNHDADKWVVAMEEEMNSLNTLGTWSYVTVPGHVAKKALAVKWVYKVKFTETQEVESFKHVWWQRSSSRSTVWVTYRFMHQYLSVPHCDSCCLMKLSVICRSITWM
jgi:hypothetical protein